LCLIESIGHNWKKRKTSDRSFFYAQVFVETYWESWIYKDYPTDYCSQLKDVPASAFGSVEGANYVNIGQKNNHEKT
jgi:hypothetical protein